MAVEGQRHRPPETRRRRPFGRTRDRRSAALPTRLAAALTTLVALTMVVLAVQPVLLPAMAHADPEPEAAGTMLLVLDSSGSMKEADASGTTKIAAAKQALNTVVDKMPADAQVGLRVYGATVFERKDPGACTDSQLVVPIGPADKPALKQAIDRYKPYGETPIAHSLKQAAKDLGSEGQRTIVLVSDGEETCDPDPCAVARAIGGQGIDLKIDVVGLNVGPKARSQLSCIAEAGHGTYYDARDAGELADTLDRSALRAYRPFSVSGTPIRGTLTPADAPAMPTGQYTDTIGGTDEDTGTKYYKVPVTPGSTLRVAVTGRPDKVSGTNQSDIQQDAVAFELQTPDGENCGWSDASRIDSYDESSVMSGTVVMYPPAAAGDCMTADAFVLKLTRGIDSFDSEPTKGELPLEIVVMEEPTVTNLDQLPDPVEDSFKASDAAVQPQQSRGDVEGGGTFSEAVEITPGTAGDTLRPGEVLFYKVRADWGQTPAVSVRLPADPTLEQLLNRPGPYPHARLDVFGPDRIEVASGYGTYSGAEEVTLTANLPAVRYRNREATSGYVKPVSIAGDYYVAVQMSEAEDGPDWQVPLEVSVAMAGEPTGQPAYVEIAGGRSGPIAGSGPDSADPAGDNSGADGFTRSVSVSFGTVATGVGVAVLLALIVVILMLRRARRRRGRAMAHAGVGAMPPSYGAQPYPGQPYGSQQQGQPYQGYQGQPQQGPPQQGSPQQGQPQYGQPPQGPHGQRPPQGPPPR